MRAATSAPASVELLVLIFCRFEAVFGHPTPMVMAPPCEAAHVVVNGNGKRCVNPPTDNIHVASPEPQEQIEGMDRMGWEVFAESA